MTAQDVTIVLYNLSLLPVVFFSILFFMLALLNLFVDESKDDKKKKLTKYPFITVQIPSFNDPIAATCIEACLKFDYPKDRYEIMILDDSTDMKTRKLLSGYAQKYGMVKYVRRDNRAGYKPGALQASLSKVKGELIVIFDADFVPKKDFLRRAAAPFEDEKVAIVQGRQGFINKDVNLVSRFAAYTLMVHHTVMMPINNKANSVFFCGTAGAIRVKALKEVGGWNTTSITEDTELSVRLLTKGYKSVYMKFETPSEVPITLESFLKQQMRWCYGNVRVWIDNAGQILYKKGLTLKQRLLITYMTMGNLIAPAVIVMTLVGMLGWFTGDPHLVTVQEISEFFIKIFYTAGFFVLAIVMLYKQRSLKEFPQLFLATLSISIILAFANTIAIFKAIFMSHKPLFRKQNNSWICTKKSGNEQFSVQ